MRCLSISEEGTGDLVASLSEGCNAPVGLLDAEQAVGFRGTADSPSSILLRNHGLHVELVVDRESAVGKEHKAGIADIQARAPRLPGQPPLPARAPAVTPRALPATASASPPPAGGGGHLSDLRRGRLGVLGRRG